MVVGPVPRISCLEALPEAGELLAAALRVEEEALSLRNVSLADLLEVDVVPTMQNPVMVVCLCELQRSLRVESMIHPSRCGVLRRSWPLPRPTWQFGINTPF